MLMRFLQGTKLPTLDTDRLRLRWLELSDAESVFEIFSDERVTRYWGFPSFAAIEQSREMLQRIQQCFLDRTLYQWGIELKQTSQLIGTCTLASLDEQNRRAEIGFALGSAFWKNGYATEAIMKLIDFAFDDLNLHRIEADVDPRNSASLRRLESLGFIREGHLKERWLVNGEVCDSILLGLLKSNWKSTDLPKRQGTP